MPLDPGAQRVLDLMREVGRPPMQTLSPQEARLVFTGSRAVLQPEPAPVATASGRVSLAPLPFRPLPYSRAKKLVSVRQ